MLPQQSSYASVFLFLKNTDTLMLFVNNTLYITILRHLIDRVFRALATLSELEIKVFIVI